MRAPLRCHKLRHGLQGRLLPHGGVTPRHAKKCETVSRHQQQQREQHPKLPHAVPPPSVCPSRDPAVEPISPARPPVLLAPFQATPKIFLLPSPSSSLLKALTSRPFPLLCSCSARVSLISQSPPFLPRYPHSFHNRHNVCRLRPVCVSQGGSPSPRAPPVMDLSRLANPEPLADAGEVSPGVRPRGRLHHGTSSPCQWLSARSS